MTAFKRSQASMVFHLALRRTEGFLRSLFALLGLDCRGPDHTTISRRARKLGKLSVHWLDVTFAIGNSTVP